MVVLAYIQQTIDSYIKMQNFAIKIKYQEGERRQACLLSNIVSIRAHLDCKYLDNI